MRQRKAKDLDKRLQQCSEYMIEDFQPGKLPECFEPRSISVGSDHISKGKVVGNILENSGDGSKDCGKESCLHDGMLQNCDGRDCSGGCQELFLEIGCGKGSFIIKKALENPDKSFIAIEGQDTVILRALEKAKAAGERADTPAGEKARAKAGKHVTESCRNSGTDFSDAVFTTRPLCNLKFMLTFVDKMSDFFLENQLSGIYLNFSDPWPKARHAKRRLTYRKRLEDYKWALKPGGFIEIKTDNDDLYKFTLEEIEATGLTITQQTNDLHNSDYDSRHTTTEYEEKFKSSGKNINYVKITV